MNDRSNGTNYLRICKGANARNANHEISESASSEQVKLFLLEDNKVDATLSIRRIIAFDRVRATEDRIKKSIEN